VSLFSLGPLRRFVRATGDREVALMGGTIIDGTGSPAIENGYIVISGTKIGAIGKLPSELIPSSAEHVDLAGMWILPGLIDSHVHLDGELSLIHI